MKLTVVIIEDEADMSQYLKTVLEDHGHMAYTSQTGANGLKLIKKLKPELVLLDLHLPDIDGRSLCQTIKTDDPKIKVIMITAQDSPHEMAGGLNIGADDYIPKPIDAGVLMARVKARFRNVQKDPVLSLKDLELNEETHEVKRAGKNVELSPQEFRLLHYLLLNQNRVLTRDMILSRIWEGTPDVETRVVDVYIGYLRKKLDTDSSKQLIHSVRGFGYVMKE